MLCPRESRHLGHVAEVMVETTVVLCVPGKCSQSQGQGRKEPRRPALLVHRFHTNKFLEAHGEAGRGLA